MPLLLGTSHYVGLAIDIVIIATILIFAFIGYYYGLLKSILALFSTVFVIGTSIYFASSFAGLINKVFNFTNLIAKNLTGSIEKLGSVYTSTVPDGLSGSQYYNSYIATSSTNTALKQFFKYALKGFSAEQISGLKVSEVLAGSLASIIMIIASAIVLFILIKIGLSLISRFFDNITRTRTLGGLNKLLGFVFGAAKGATIVLVFIILTICASFIPKVNKKIYPMIQEQTYITKVAYNTTDKIVDKYVIKSDLLTNWINKVWDSRQLNKQEPTPPVEPEQTILDKATNISTLGFSLSVNGYECTFNNLEITNDTKYYKLDKLNDLLSTEHVDITITLTYTETGTDLISCQLFRSPNIDTEITKDATSTDKMFVYKNVDYATIVFGLSTSECNYNVSSMQINIKATAQE